LAYEDDALGVLKAYEKEGWLKVLNPRWSTAKVDSAGLGGLTKTRQQMNELGYQPDMAAPVLHFLTARMGYKDVADLRRAIPRKDLIEAWKDLDDNARDLAKRLMGKEAATPSRTWQLLSSARPEMVLYLAVTARQQAVAQKIKNFFTKWRQVQQKIPLPEMTELRITAQMPEYPKIANDVFMLLLDGKLRSHTETMKYLKPLAPPPPPPPPPVKRGRGAKAAVPVADKGKVKGKEKAPAAAPATVVGKPAAGKADVKVDGKAAKVAAPIVGSAVKPAEKPALAKAAAGTRSPAAVKLPAPVPAAPAKAAAEKKPPAKPAPKAAKPAAEKKAAPKKVAPKKAAPKKAAAKTGKKPGKKK